MARPAGGALISTPRTVDTTQSLEVRRRQRRRRGLQVRDLHTPKLKDEFYGHLALTDPAAPGWITLPACGDELCKQLCAEHLERKRVQGVEREVWTRTYANHALDAAIYARAAFELAKVWMQPTAAEWSAREARLRVEAPPPSTPPPAPPTAAAPVDPDDAADDTDLADDAAPPALARTTAPTPVEWRRSEYWRGWDRRR